MLIASAALLFSSCEDADPGPIQEHEEEYVITDFDRLDIGDAFDVTVEQGSTYSVKVKGDRRNIEDLDVRKSDGTLIIQFQRRERRDYRQYQTYITITMPALAGVNFSGAVAARATGFISEFDMEVDLSGASTLDITGKGKDLDADLSGASRLHAFEFETETASVDASGASRAEVSVTKELNVKASGASRIRYRGNPSLSTDTSGASSVEED